MTTPRNSTIAAGIFLLSCALGGLVVGRSHVSGSPAPAPAYSASQVVQFQLEALGRNDEPEPDAGIAVAFRFASPGNQEQTGPLERFAQIVKAPAYRPMLNHRGVDYGETVTRGRYAVQTVTVLSRSGSRYVYVFELSQQRGGALDGCWLTDSVRLVHELDGEGATIAI